MDNDDLRKMARQYGVPQAIVEKDYVLSIVLQELSKSYLKDKVIFKGGTALKKIYFGEARFSEDLDFSCVNLEKADIIDALKPLLENKEIANVRFDSLETQRTPAGLRLSLKFTSFLSQPQRIRFDFSFRENLVLPAEERILFDDYSLDQASIKVLTLPELFAEKIHAVLSRVAARDLYDIWFLLGKNVNTDSTIVRKKFAYYKEKFDFEKLENKINSYEKYWNQDLRQLLPKVPDFKVVSKEVLDKLRKLHLGDDPVTSNTQGTHNPKHS